MWQDIPPICFRLVIYLFRPKSAAVSSPPCLFAVA